MNDGFKQRLVGAVVLACIALIIWPILFSDSNRPVVDRNTQIPSVPEFKQFEVKKPVRPANVEAADVADLFIDPVESKPATKAPESDKKVAKETPQLDRRSIPVSWTLQVASFSKQANANDVKAKLQAKGLKAYTRSIKSKEGNVTRVFVGPKLTKTALLREKPKIDKMFDVDSIVVRFKP